MGVFEMVVIIVAIGCLTGVVTAYLDSKAKSGAGKASDAERAELDAMKSRIAQAEKDNESLRQRVQVLEKLVTDDDHRLAKEIGQLGASDRA